MEYLFSSPIVKRIICLLEGGRGSLRCHLLAREGEEDEEI